MSIRYFCAMCNGRHQRFAARTGKTSKTSTLCAETMRDFLGNALLPKSATLCFRNRRSGKSLRQSRLKDLSHSRSNGGNSMVQWRQNSLTNHIRLCAHVQTCDLHTVLLSVPERHMSAIPTPVLLDHAQGIS